MAENPLFHIIDSIYFEVPEQVWNYDVETVKDKAPAWLVRQHPEASPEEMKEALDGKILIPQPFGTPVNFYGKAESGFLITRLMVVELVAALIVGALFIWLANRLQNGALPKGKLTNLLETMVVFIRDSVARPTIGHHDADAYMPILWTLFFFILACNLLGLVPFLGTVTGAFAVTLALSVITLLVVVVGGMIRFGVVGFWTNMVPKLGLPWYGFIIVGLVFAIELASFFIKHGVLAVRLLANMDAGHLVLFSLMNLPATVGVEVSSLVGGLVILIAFLASIAFMLLELFVAFLQAYVFTFLSALFIGAAIHHH